ncbi:MULTISPECIES: HAD domain-containing protein [Paraburkholderia]|uniref:HAD domain-containing protein n=1 Tax=Paraburkholderia TaxID=1822464 RepID=UPI001CA3C4B1
MNSVLYLGLEGLLIPWHASGPALSDKRECISAVTDLSSTIVDAVLKHPDISIVLNSWWVAAYGYRRLLYALPDEIARRTVGSTTRGNRMHRSHGQSLTRADTLRSDIARRNPARLTILDAYRSAVPFEYLPRALTLPSGSSFNVKTFCSRLDELLTADS